MRAETACTFSYPLPNGYWDNYWLIFSLSGVHLLGTHGKKQIKVVPSSKHLVKRRSKYIIEVGHLVNYYTDGEEALRLFLSQPEEKQDAKIKGTISALIQQIGHDAGINETGRLF